MAAVLNLLRQTRNVPVDEVKSYINGLCSILSNAEINVTESIESLRQIHLLLLHREDISLPSKLIEFLVKFLNQEDLNAPLLASVIQSVLYVVPCNTLIIPQGQKDSAKFISIIASKPIKDVDVLMSQLVSFTSTVGYSLNTQVRALSLSVALTYLYDYLPNKEHRNIINSHVSDWMMKASITEAPNPYKRAFFGGKGDQPNSITEIDGSVTRDFFTVLNVGKYYTEDQLLNIHSFSTLKVWLLQYVGDENIAVDHQFLENVIDYCFRVIDQAERKPKVLSDFEVQQSVTIEAVSVLDVVCRIDATLIPRVFQTVKRLHSKLVLAQDISQPRILLTLLQFFLNHSEAVVYDVQPFLDFYFDKVIQSQFGNSSIAFDTVMFIHDNLETLCHSTQTFKFFPNMLKLLAWNPRSFTKEFIDIIPAMLSETTAIEVLHALLDLPCMTASLEVSCRLGKSDVGSLFSSVTEAMASPANKPLFSFVLRNEGGFCDTIDRLNKLHVLLEDLNNLPRVTVCCQVVPILVKLFFTIIREEGDEKLSSRLLPVVLERIDLLYKSTILQRQIKKIFGEVVLMLLEQYPSLVVHHHKEILDYVSTLRNAAAANEDFYVNLVWSIGEYCFETYNKECNSKIISDSYMVLECVSYQVIKIQQTAPTSCPLRILAVLMTSQAKLASRCQDLIPRVLLCLNKITRLQESSNQNNNDRHAIIDRANDLINLLKIPNVALSVLTPGDEIHSFSSHKNNTSTAVLLKTLSDLLRDQSINT